jgi:hypothetical protein
VVRKQKHALSPCSKRKNRRTEQDKSNLRIYILERRSPFTLMSCLALILYGKTSQNAGVYYMLGFCCKIAVNTFKEYRLH